MDDFPCTPDLFSPSSSSSSSSPGKITLSKSSHTVYDTHRHVYLHIQTAIPGYDHKIHQLPTNSVTLHSLLEKKLLRINRKRRKQLTMDDLEWKARMINSIYPKRQIKITWVVDPTKSEDDCYDNTTGTWGNAQEEADSHFTVWMGYNRYQLVLQGHIYVVWEEKEFGYLKKMETPAEQRKHVDESLGEKYVSEEYWSLTKDELRLKEQGTDAAAAPSS
ncbi:hypothetical protein SMACR_09596 [Sordaria macrospora]|uniref:WGS project CABT00000000 data, contig 2.106 n=2 Tax=Sordaria macrospora TaxID=5147 RepID=F7WCA2_SORMK|nr:uncharacterized protein SMAC_09596 [Sordaria macrospora k-hell]KAA8631077.1 hypothetical protein SMACR_09596 [Sordaria macrospora]WPJ63911.1 hypothetical protein SMAC4_09596 [Sordaria macrospora]CCC14570.1 unnamed protein product [Sordaria macrospora k-hell]